ncbi:MAG: hypothetical protein ABW189_02125 [Rickettsiales bacterium]
MSETDLNVADETHLKQLFYRLYRQIDAVYSDASAAAEERQGFSEGDYFALENKLTHIEGAGDALCRSLFSRSLPAAFSESAANANNENCDASMKELLGAIENYGRFCRAMASSPSLKPS